MARTIFDISEDLLQLDELLESLTDESEQREAVDEYLRSIETELTTKLDGYCMLISELEARAKARRAEADRLLHRSRVDENKVSSLKNCLRWFMFTHQLQSVDTPSHKIVLQRNGGVQPVLLTIAPEDLPDEFRTQTMLVKPDMDAIRRALETGKSVPGAALAERGHAIRIL